MSRNSFKIRLYSSWKLYANKRYFEFQTRFICWIENSLFLMCWSVDMNTEHFSFLVILNHDKISHSVRSSSPNKLLKQVFREDSHSNSFLCLEGLARKNLLTFFYEKTVPPDFFYLNLHGCCKEFDIILLTAWKVRWIVTPIISGLCQRKIFTNKFLKLILNRWLLK